MSYSQRDEEDVILRYFYARGNGLPGEPTPPGSHRFLDIGAHDGVTYSNTRALSDRGWSGILVEPSPAAFASLQKNYDGRKADLVQVAIVPFGPPRQVDFHDSGGDMVSTVSEGHRALWTGGPGHRNVLPNVDERVSFQTISVPATTIADLVTKFPGPYDFLSLDVEGINLEIFETIDLRALGIQLACVEYQERRVDIELHASLQGYKRIHATIENLLLARS